MFMPIPNCNCDFFTLIRIENLGYFKNQTLQDEKMPNNKITIVGKRKTLKTMEYIAGHKNVQPKNNTKISKCKGGPSIFWTLLALTSDTEAATAFLASSSCLALCSSIDTRSAYHHVHTSIAHSKQLMLVIDTACQL